MRRTIVNRVNKLYVSKIYHSLKYYSVQFMTDDGYNRDESTELPVCVPYPSDRMLSKACANLQTIDMR